MLSPQLISSQQVIKDAAFLSLIQVAIFFPFTIVLETIAEKEKAPA